MSNLIDLNAVDTKNFLKAYGLTQEKFEKLLDLIHYGSQEYYQSEEAVQQVYETLQEFDSKDANPSFDKAYLKKKQDWEPIQNMRSGDRGYVSRYLISCLPNACRELYTQQIEPRLIANSKTQHLTHVALDLSHEFTTLILITNLPGYFQFLDLLGNYKSGVFKSLRLQYLNFIETRTIHLIALFLKECYDDLNLLDHAFLGAPHSGAWSKINEVILSLSKRADAHHHAPFNVKTINDLRTIYIALFNIAMVVLESRGKVPLELRRLLTVIPDHLDFTREGLQRDRAWNLYQEHHFLFMSVPPERRQQFESCLKGLTPQQRVMWMGCLGKEEIRALIAPMTSEPKRFTNLVSICEQINVENREDTFFSSRVYEIAQQVYQIHLKQHPETPEALHQRFSEKTALPDIKKEEPPFQKTHTSSAAPSFSEELRNRVYLVVDDSERIRTMTIKVLQNAGIHTIYSATQGQEAWELIQKHSIDIVLCDWLMPLMSGLALLKIIMDSPYQKSITFLMLTTVDDKASIVEAISLGAKGYLIKPFTTQQLFTQIMKAIA
ncbi:response regulator [Deltaproteobacteria bacterium TL4]